MVLRAVWHEVRLINVVDQVRDAQVQVRADRAAVRGHERRHHHTQEADGQEAQAHGRIGRFSRRALELWKVNQRQQPHDDPRPGPQYVLAEVVPEKGVGRLALVLCRQQALHVETAAGHLEPPDDSQVDDKREGAQVERLEPRREVQQGRFELRRRGKFGHHPLAARGVNIDDHRQGDTADHGKEELEDVRVDHAVEAGNHAVGKC